MKIKKIILHILLPLLAGVFIYIFFREPVTFLHKLLSIDKPFFSLPPGAITYFILFRLPDMCWAYGLTSSLILWTGVNKFICAVISILFLSLFEFNQAGWHWQHVDFFDCGVMTLATILAVIFIRK